MIGRVTLLSSPQHTLWAAFLPSDASQARPCPRLGLLFTSTVPAEMACLAPSFPFATELCYVTVKSTWKALNCV